MSTYLSGIIRELFPKEAPPQLRQKIVEYTNCILTEDEIGDVCPYDESHKGIILARDYRSHVSNCRQTYLAHMKETGQDPELVKCPFEVCFKFPKKELEGHMENCIGRVHFPYLLSHEKTKEHKLRMKKLTEYAAQVKLAQDTAKKNEKFWAVNGIFEDWAEEAEAEGYQKGYRPEMRMDPNNKANSDLKAADKKRDRALAYYDESDNQYELLMPDNEMYAAPMKLNDEAIMIHSDLKGADKEEDCKYDKESDSKSEASDKKEYAPREILNVLDFPGLDDDDDEGWTYDVSEFWEVP